MTTTKTAASLTVDPAEFHGLLVDLMRSASDDSALPMINGVLLHLADHDGTKVLVGTSTNRFLAAQAFINAGGDLAPLWLDLSRVKQIVAILKPYTRANNLLTELSIADDKLVVRQPGDIVLPAVSITVPVGDQHDSFPKMAKLFAPDEDAATGDAVTFDPRWLSVPLAVAKRRGERFTFTTVRVKKANFVQVGERYRALLMPVNESAASVPFFAPPHDTTEPARPEAVAA